MCSRSRPPVPVAVEDRKSTRLNSSHMSISYAVFCLKKKKGALEHPAGPALQRRRPVPQREQDAGPDRDEVLDDVDLADAALAEVRLLRAGYAHLVPVDLQHDGVLARGHRRSSSSGPGDVAQPEVGQVSPSCGAVRSIRYESTAVVTHGVFG